MAIGQSLSAQRYSAAGRDFIRRMDISLHYELRMLEYQTAA